MPRRRTAILGLLLAAALVATTPIGTDYGWGSAPAIRALAHGDLRGFVAARPQMGPASIALRAPIEAVLGTGTLWAYRIGALACLAGMLALAAGLSRRLPRDAALAATAVLVVNPAVIDALRLGHPEGPLFSALAVAAVLVARRRPLAAAVLLGGAIAVKQTALIAVVPVLLAVPRPARARAATVAAGVVGLAYLPSLLLDPHAAIAALHKPAFGVGGLRPGNVWGPLATTSHVDLGGGGRVVGHTVPNLLRGLAHPVIAALLVACPVVAARHRRLDPLALLALVALARCAFDPWDHAYYHVIFLTALVAWETVVAKRVPYVAMLCAACIALVFSVHDLLLSDLLYVAWAAPCAAWLCRCVAAPSRVSPPRAAVPTVA